MGWTDRFTKKTKQDEDSSLMSRLANAPFDYIQLTPEARRQLIDWQDTIASHPLVLVGAGCTISFGLGVRVGQRYLQTPFWRRFTAVIDMPSSSFHSSQWLRGRVVSVSDGDTVRFLHVPTVFHPKTVGNGEKLSETALSIRVCTIDTPETAKFGKPGQAFGDDAKDYLESLVTNKTVRARMLMKDQYGRGVAELKVGRSIFGKYVDEQMLKAGLAEVYQGSGAVYGRLGKEKYLQLEQKARDAKKGIWSTKRESAAEYKARTK